jgi:hypothetical protein
MTETLCATTSCSSRAMRARSAATATLACASRSFSSRVARSTSWSKYARRVRIESPSTQARTNGTVRTIVKKNLPDMLTSCIGQRTCATGAARIPPASASLEAHRFPPCAATV